MFRYSQANGLPVVTLKEGRQVGMLDEVLIDVSQRAIRWLRLRQSRWFSKARWAPAEAVHGLGDDAVILEGTASLTDDLDGVDEQALVRARQGLLGRTMLTESGQRLGEVKDYEFRSDDLALTHLLVTPRRNLFGQPLHVPIDQVLTIGEDAILVQDGHFLPEEPAQPPIEAFPEPEAH